MTTHFMKNVNYSIRLAKWYIHRQVYLKWNTYFFNFLLILKCHLDTGKCICTCNGRLHTLTYNGLRYMNVFNWLIFNSLLNFVYA